MYDYQNTLPPIQFLDPVQQQRRQAEEAQAAARGASLAVTSQKQDGGSDALLASLAIGALSQQPAAAAKPAVPAAQREAAYNKEMSETSSATPTGEGLGPTYGKPQVWDPNEAILPPLTSEPGGAAPPPVRFSDPDGPERRTREEAELQRLTASAQASANKNWDDGSNDGAFASLAAQYI